MGKTPSDVVWLAGYLEGEGCFFYDKPRHTGCIALETIDKDVARKVARIMGTKMYGPYFREGRQPAYRVQMRHAESWMEKVYDMMGTRRRAKIREVLRKYKRRA